MEPRTLTKLGHIRIGWSSARIRERVEEEQGDRCFRCREKGHVARFCGGTDRTNMCHNCDKAGHMAWKCSEARRCHVCSGTGHRAGDRSCKGKKNPLNEATGETHILGEGRDSAPA